MKGNQGKRSLYPRKNDVFRIAESIRRGEYSQSLFQDHKPISGFEEEFPLNFLSKERSLQRSEIWQNIRARVKHDSESLISLCQSDVLIFSRLFLAQSLLFDQEIKYHFRGKDIAAETKLLMEETHMPEADMQRKAAVIKTSPLYKLTERERIDILKKALTMSGELATQKALKQEIQKRASELQRHEESLIFLPLCFGSLIVLHDLFSDALKKFDPGGILSDISPYTAVRCIAFVKEELQSRVELLEKDKRLWRDLTHNTFRALVLLRFLYAKLLEKESDDIIKQFSVEYFIESPIINNLVISHKQGALKLRDNYLRDHGEDPDRPFVTRNEILKVLRPKKIESEKKPWSAAKRRDFISSL